VECRIANVYGDHCLQGFIGLRLGQQRRGVAFVSPQKTRAAPSPSGSYSRTCFGLRMRRGSFAHVVQPQGVAYAKQARKRGPDRRGKTTVRSRSRSLRLLNISRVPYAKAHQQQAGGVLGCVFLVCHTHTHPVPHRPRFRSSVIRGGVRRDDPRPTAHGPLVPF